MGNQNTRQLATWPHSTHPQVASIYAAAASDAFGTVISPLPNGGGSSSDATAGLGLISLPTHCGRLIVPFWSASYSFVISMLFPYGRPIIPLWPAYHSLVAGQSFIYGRPIIP